MPTFSRRNMLQGLAGFLVGGLAVLSGLFIADTVSDSPAHANPSHAPAVTTTTGPGTATFCNANGCYPVPQP